MSADSKFACRNATWLSILLFLVIATVEVDIQHIMGPQFTITCQAIPPGQCCCVPILMQHQSPTLYPIAIAMGPLMVQDLGMIFEARGNLGACNALPPVKRLQGPGTFLVRNSPAPPRTEQFLFTGASYVTLPNSIPVDTTASEMLAAQGLLSLTTASESWFAPNTKWRVSPRTRPKSRRGIIRGQKGHAYVGPPPQNRYPDVITINGTDYRSSNTSELNYQSANGQLLDLAALGL